MDDSGSGNWGYEVGAALQALKINSHEEIFASLRSPLGRYKHDDQIADTNIGNDNGNPGGTFNTILTRWHERSNLSGFGR